MSSSETMDFNADKERPVGAVITGGDLLKKSKKSLEQLKRHDPDVEVASEPTKILFVDNSSVLCSVSHKELQEIFSRFDSAVELIVFPNRRAYSFVEFSSVDAASKAKDELNGKVPEQLKKSHLPFVIEFVMNVPLSKTADGVAGPRDLQIVDEFVDEGIERDLIDLVMTDPRLNEMKHRSVLHWGHAFDYSTDTVFVPTATIPDRLEAIVDRLLEKGHIRERPDQITAHVYSPGQCIPSLLYTCSAFEDPVVSLSLLADVVMEFKDAANSARVAPVLLPRRSLCLMQGDSRSQWKHGVVNRQYDVCPRTNRLLPRRQRVSITFRKIRRAPCTCDPTASFRCDLTKPYRGCHGCQLAFRVATELSVQMEELAAFAVLPRSVLDRERARARTPYERVRPYFRPLLPPQPPLLDEELEWIPPPIELFAQHEFPAEAEGDLDEELEMERISYEEMNRDQGFVPVAVADSDEEELLYDVGLNRAIRVVDEDGLTEEEDEDEETAEVNRRFRAAVAFVPSAVDRLDKQTLLTLYGLYKTGTEGRPNAADRPSFFDQKGLAEFDAWWQAAERCTKREAQREYADRLEAAGVGFDPLAMASTSGGFGMRMSRPMMAGDMSATPDAPASPDAEEWTLWTGAAKADDVETCRRVLAVNPAIMLKREEDSGLTGMHWAADSGSINVCRYLLSVQPSLIAELDIEGNQPLHLAALCGYPDVVQLLLEAGASPTVENLEKESAIDIAATPALKRLLMARADEIDEEEERKNEVKGGDEEEEVKVNGGE